MAKNRNEEENQTGAGDFESSSTEDFDSEEHTVAGHDGDAQVVGSTPDPIYDVISLVYHSLKGAEVCEEYLADAEGDEELQGFLTDAQAEYEEIAERGKAILATRLASARPGMSQAAGQGAGRRETPSH